jgi:hypothetical protein
LIKVRGLARVVIRVAAGVIALTSYATEAAVVRAVRSERVLHRHRAIPHLTVLVQKHIPTKSQRADVLASGAGAPPTVQGMPLAALLLHQDPAFRPSESVANQVLHAA